MTGMKAWHMLLAMSALALEVLNAKINMAELIVLLVNFSPPIFAEPAFIML